MPSSVDCSIIIVNWNVREYLRDCLRSLPPDTARHQIEVIVVDNGSNDGSLDMLQKEFPWVKTIALGTNRGFARANNRGIGHASGRYILFLNPDTEIVSDAVSRMIDSLDAHPDRALVAPQLIHPDGTFQAGSIRRDPTLPAQAIILLKLQHAVAQIPWLQQYYATDFQPEREQEIEQPMGAALCVRRDVLNKVGSFDEGFFLWFEEVDLCKRIRANGGTIWYLPSAKVVHHSGKSFDQHLPLAKQRIYNKSAIRYFRKHEGLLAASLLYVTIPINLLLVYLYQFAQTRGKRER